MEPDLEDLWLVFEPVLEDRATWGQVSVPIRQNLRADSASLPVLEDRASPRRPRTLADAGLDGEQRASKASGRPASEGFRVSRALSSVRSERSEGFRASGVQRLPDLARVDAVQRFDDGALEERGGDLRDGEVGRLPRGLAHALQRRQEACFHFFNKRLVEGIGPC